MNYYKYFIFTLLFVCFSTLADVTYFSCKTDKGDLMLKEKNKNLEYNFLNRNDDVFIFSAPPIKFSYSHYYRFQTDYFDVSFFNGKYKYSIFSNFEDGNYSKGVNVKNIDSKKEYSFACNNTEVDRLRDLSGKLKCDTNSALGCG